MAFLELLSSLLNHIQEERLAFLPFPTLSVLLVLRREVGVCGMISGEGTRFSRQIFEIFSSPSRCFK